MKRIVGLYIAWLIAAALLAAAVTQRQPYNFYVLLHWVCCAVFAVSAFTANEQHRKIWFWIFVVLAVLFNPIVPVHLKRDTWQVLDSGAVAVMVIAAIFFWHNPVDDRTAHGATATTTGETRQAKKIEAVPPNPNGNAAKLHVGPGLASGSLNLRRTLCGAAIGASMAMILVPCVRHRYEPIFKAADYEINVAQLLLNVSFAALVGALASNLSRRAWRTLGWISGALALLVAVWLGFTAFQQEMETDATREEGLAYGAVIIGNFDSAKEHLLKAANYWEWKGWRQGARQARERALNEPEMKKTAAAARAHMNEERARQLLRMTNVFNQFDSSEIIASDENVKQAKQLLLDAAESWHIAGNDYEERRVKEWEKKVKTKAEFLASLPDQPPKDPFDDLTPPKKATITGVREPWETDPVVQLTTPNSGINEAKTAEEQRARLDWEAEEAQCRAALNYPPVKWDHRTEFGKTFAIIKFRERRPGDRKKELDGYAKAIGARFYKQWSRVRKGGADFVEVVFYK